jgi:hypothetical protein
VEPFTSTLPISGSMKQESALVEGHKGVERKNKPEIQTQGLFFWVSPI